MRRPKVKRDRNGDPILTERCAWLLWSEDELLPRYCRRARKRGWKYCAQHARQWQERGHANA